MPISEELEKDSPKSDKDSIMKQIRETVLEVF
ncbi:hypothetical protein CCUS01_11460 [Colletotrichum cuscutae]|uniref:Uncharacterized protein n=1 Tax=Colletotrichum cuscutae TaxID=1209917 RepID=A0AAI9U0T7_9PEZI|nr:hypothetical protein CCUS01_11460 [Colletotrichum cuscutae]